MTARAKITQAEYVRRAKALRQLVGDPNAPVEITAEGAVRLLTPEPANDALTPLQRWRAEQDAKRAAQGS